MKSIPYNVEKLWQFFALMELKSNLYYFLITKTHNLSNEKYILA